MEKMTEAEARQMYETILQPYWEQWMTEAGADPGDKVFTKMFAEQFHAKENSPVSLMFAAFVGGFGMGLDFAGIHD